MMDEFFFSIALLIVLASGLVIGFVAGMIAGWLRGFHDRSFRESLSDLSPEKEEEYRNRRRNALYKGII